MVVAAVFGLMVVLVLVGSPVLTYALYRREKRRRPWVTYWNFDA